MSSPRKSVSEAVKFRSGFSLVALALLAVLVLSCAYYNTLYNAEDKFAEAEKAQAAQMRAIGGVPGGAGGGSGGSPVMNTQAAAYEDVIEKCKKVIANYPDSRHVDDAMLLSAKSLYRLAKYEEAVAAIDTLETRFPKTELLADATFLKGKSFVAAEKYDLAVPTLKYYAEKYRKHDDRPEGLYLLCISLMQIGMNEEAVKALAVLEEDHGRSDYRFRAQVDMAEVLADKELYNESLAVYQRLSQSRIPETVRFDVLMGMARVQEKLGANAAALQTLGRIQQIPPGPDNEPKLMLLRANGYAGVDSTARAIRIFRDVTKRFARGTYAAEAHFRLGELYEASDSLQAAQTNYQEVPRAYSGSEFAEEAIKRGSNIGRVLKLQQTSGDDSPEAIAMRTFSMAEIQFFQFNNAEKAIPSYEKIVVEFPESEYAPRAAYALGYIHGVVLGDSLQARAWYDTLLARYPDSPQTQMAYSFYKGAMPPPPYSELIKTATVLKPGQPMQPTPRRQPPPRPTPAPPPPADSTGVPADSTSTPAQAPPAEPAPADTSTAPVDSSGGGG